MLDCRIFYGIPDMNVPAAEWGSRSIVYYVSAHGYGHGVRSADILRALNALRAQQPLFVVSGLPKAFFDSRLGDARYHHRNQTLDVGMVQLDSIRCDPEATLTQLEHLCRKSAELVSREIDFFRANRVGLVVADIPGIPLEAAYRERIPRLAVGNFGWDWLYSYYVDSNPRWKPIVELFGEEYSKTDLLLRLPFCEEMGAFPRVEDIPLVASAGTNRREEIAGLTGCDVSKKWILLSFTSLDWDNAALLRVEELESYEFFTVLPLYWKRRNIHCLDRAAVPFADVVASVDGVLSKPGFGILSECAVNCKPLLYADRTDFAEYQILEAALKKYFKCLCIPSERLYRGEIGAFLEKLWGCTQPQMTLVQGGAQIAAGRMMDFLA
jgi:hypothetical protein